MPLYTASMQHSAETVKIFTRLQYDTFEWWRKLLTLFLSALLILSGFFYGSASGSSILTIGCLFVGCILFTSLNARANAVADQVVEALQGKFPTLQYSFSETGFTDGDDRPIVSYDRLFRLIEDEQYLYLFSSKASGYMLSKVSVRGEGDVAGLMELLAQRSGKPWKKPFSLLTFRIWDLFSKKE